MSTATIEKPPVAEIVKPKVEPPKIERFQLAHLGDYAAWLGERLKERYDDIDSRTLATRLTGWMGSNAHLFIKTKNAVTLAELRNEFLNPHKTVRVVFLLCKEFNDKQKDAAAIKEGAYLCMEIERWARNMNVAQVDDWEYHNDLDRETIKLHTSGKMYIRESTLTKVREVRDASA